MKTAVIGVGNMGTRYACLLQDGTIEGMELGAVTRIRERQRELLAPSLANGLPVYESADALFDAFEKGEIHLDAVIIATPHRTHCPIALRAFANGLHVLTDKPAGICSRQARQMEEAARESGCVYGIIFNQRTLPQFQFLHDIVHSGKYGALKRMEWVVTDWYRPNSYYASGSWRATWNGEGGGVLLNQCPHNLDLLQWICGMPEKVRAFCNEGRYHPIAVEDDVTMFLEWENGAHGTFITSTGEAPGINRLEIVLEDAMLVYENGEVRIGELVPELGCPEEEYRRTVKNPFAKIRGTWKTYTFEKPDDPYRIILQGFADEIAGKGECIVPGSEGRKSLMISNAAYWSSWKDCRVSLPEFDTRNEQLYEYDFEMLLKEKMKEEEQNTCAAGSASAS